MRGTPFREIAAAGALTLLLGGCAVPGAPVTRQPLAARAITDLSAKQSGDSVVLSFTLPTETTGGRALPRPPALEIYRSFVQGAQGSAPPQLVTTVPPQMVDQYRENRAIRFPDTLAPDDFAAHTGGDAVYVVRTRLEKHDSGDSNVARVHLLPAPQPVEDLRAVIGKQAVTLWWTAPAILPAGGPPPVSVRYGVYRSEAPSTASAPPRPAALSVLLGETSTPSYEDTSFSFGKTYAYTVRTVATFPAGAVESGDSNVLSVTPRDTFTPETPENVALALTPGQGSAPPHVDLSWAINNETDLLGYNVYRSESDSGAGARVNPSPLITPVFRDDSVVPGKRYFYRVTAVDRSGKESSPTAPVAVTVPAENRDGNPQERSEVENSL